MRARLLIIAVCLTTAIAGCGDGQDDSTGDAKQTKVSAKAYPAVKTFAASNIELADYGPVCDRLAAVKEDRVAAASEPTCRRLVELTKQLEPFQTIVRGCDDVDCIADKAQALISRYLTTFRKVLRSHNEALAGVLKPGPCLSALQVPQADLNTIDASLRRLPAAVERFRGGDKNALDGLFDGGLGAPDPAPCKP
jgi:hypothetical protein